MIGTDGFTAYEKIYGRKPHSQTMEIGEKIWWRPLQPSGRILGAQDPRFEEGFYLGPIDDSTSVAVSTLDGDVVQARAMKRRTAEERWDPEGLLKLKVCELQPNGEDTEDGRYKIRAPTARDPIPEADLPERMDAEPEYVPKRAYLSREDFRPERCGYTPHCPGCMNIRRGGRKAVHHSETCRRRVEAMMRADPASARRLERADDRINENIAARVEENLGGERDEPPVEEAPRRRRTRRTEGVEQSGKRARTSGEAPREPDIEEAVRRFPTLSGEADTEGGAAPDDRDGDGDMEMGLISETEMMDIMMLYSNEGNVHGGGHVSEVYSPPRVAPLAAKYGLEQGYSLDLTTFGDDGQPYDFDKRSHRRRARQLLREKRPGLLICSPMCTAFSSLMHLNRERMGEKRYAQWMAKGRRHLKFVMELCRDQMASGNYFLFEHPAFASSWMEPELVSLVKHQNVMTVIGNMCRFGMTGSLPDGSEELVLKPTRFATNSRYLALALDKKCSKDHPHASLMNHRAAAAQVYPPIFVKPSS